jgi:hypothetical protein
MISGDLKYDHAQKETVCGGIRDQIPGNLPSRAGGGWVELNRFQKDAREVIKRIMEDLPRNAGNAE